MWPVNHTAATFSTLVLEAVLTSVHEDLHRHVLSLLHGWVGSSSGNIFPNAIS